MTVCCKAVVSKGCLVVVNCCNQVAVGEGSMDCTLGDEEELPGDSRLEEASFDKDEVDSQGRMAVVHMSGREAGSNLVTAIRVVVAGTL